MTTVSDSTKYFVAWIEMQLLADCLFPIIKINYGRYILAKVSKTEMEAFFSREFHQANFVFEAFDEDAVTIRRKVDTEDLRPGKTRGHW